GPSSRSSRRIPLRAAGGRPAGWRDASSLPIDRPAWLGAIVMAHPVGEVAAAGLVAAFGREVAVRISADQEGVASAVGRVGVEENALGISREDADAGALFTDGFA